jgi:hypothetical protein
MPVPGAQSLTPPTGRRGTGMGSRAGCCAAVAGPGRIPTRQGVRAHSVALTPRPYGACAATVICTKVKGESRDRTVAIGLVT